MDLITKQIELGLRGMVEPTDAHSQQPNWQMIGRQSCRQHGIDRLPSETAAGFNWYPLSKATMKISFDVTQLRGSPLQNTTTDILVGDTGTLFRTQFQAEF